MSKKKIFLGFILCVALGLGLVWFFINDIARSAIEKVASKALKTPVTVESVAISFMDQSVTVSGLVIKTPEGHGFTKSDMIIVPRIEAKIERFRGTPLRITSIIVDGTTINAEMSKLKVNLKTFKDNLGKASKIEESAGESGSSEASDTQKVIIDSLVIKNTSIAPHLTDLDKEIAPVTLSPLEFKGIGEKDGGILAKEAVRMVVRDLVTQAAGKVSTSGLLNADILNRDKLESTLKDSVKEGLGGLGGLLE